MKATLRTSQATEKNMRYMHDLNLKFNPIVIRGNCKLCIL